MMSNPYDSNPSRSDNPSRSEPSGAQTDRSGDGASGHFDQADLGNEAKAHAKDAREDIKQGVSATKDRLQNFANQQKDAGAEHVSGFAQAAHKAADALGEQNPGLADLVHEAADGLNRMSNSLREQDVSQLYGTVNDFARRQPMVFLAGSLAAGIVLARFLKSSAKAEPRYRARDMQDRDGQPYHSSPSL